VTRARRAWRLLWLGTTATLLLSPSPAAAAAARTNTPAATITVGGVSAAHPLAADLMFFYRRERPRAPRFALVGGGNATGIADVARRVVDAAVTDRPPDAGDPAGLHYTPLARSALCVVTNPANPVANVTPGALARTAWAGTRASRGTLTPSPPTRTFATQALVREHVLATAGAWGIVEIAFTAGLNVVAYDGLECSPAAPYPARREYGVVTRGTPRGALGRFLRWIARDATARRVIASRYVVP
jgi:phosphate transport system substrate-binding protein